MNVFVLCTGRSGSTTFVMSCRHITNYTAGHETRARLSGGQRLAYPANHIEADNRLSWMLGRLDRAYGDTAFYVHLTRNPDQVAESFRRRLARKEGIIAAYRGSVLMGGPDVSELAVCRDYIDTVTENIALFLRNKSRWMHFAVETPLADLERFWAAIGATGDREAAKSEWSVRYNASAA